MSKIPVTVFTGYLGSGKTTIILNLIKQLDPNYKIVWLKNEFGDVSIDSELAHENNIQVKEMLNGCLCCVLIGKLKDALDEIVANYQPQRIIIESSGTAFPMPIVFEINRVPQLLLDGVVNVVDAENFGGYKYKDYVAKMQAQATDLIIINKVGLTSPENLETVLDDVYELNPHTPKIRTKDAEIPQDVLLGLDSHLVAELKDYHPESEHHDAHQHPDDVQTFAFFGDGILEKPKVESILEPLKQRGFIRIKGVVQTAPGTYELLNWVFGRVMWQPLTHYAGQTKIVFMGKDMLNLKDEVLGSLSA